MASVDYILNGRKKAEAFVTAAGQDSWTRQQGELKRQQTDFSGYLNSGNYSLDNNKKYRDMATQAVADLDTEMKRYGKSSNEYKTLDSYKNYYQNALPTFDRIDVGLNANDYISSDAWHSKEDYEAQRTSLQNSIDSIQAEMDAIGNEEADDYKQLAAYRDWYQKIMDGGEDGFGLAQREEHDRQFKDIDEYTKYQRAQDYGNNVQIKKTLADVSSQLDTAKADFKQAQIDYSLGKIEYQDLVLADQKAKALEEQKNQLNEDLSGLEEIQYGTIYNNYVDQYGEDADYRPIVDSLIEDREKARRLYGEDSSEYEKIDRTIKVLAGDNEESLTNNDLVTDATLYGQSVLRDIDREALQTQIDEIDAKLKELGAEQTTGMGWLATLGNAAQSSQAAQAGQYDQVQAANERIQTENSDEVRDLRAKRQNLQRLLNSSENLQNRETARTELPKVEGYEQYVEAGKNSVQKVQNANGKEVYAYTLPGYDKNAEDSERAKYSRLLDDFGSIADNKNYQWLSDMIYAAVGAEVEGKDIGYTVQDLMDTYGGLISQVKGLEQAQRVRDIDSDFVRWNAQVLGVGTQAGLNQFTSGVKQAFSTDYIEPNSTAIMAQKVREDIGEQYGGKKFFQGSGNGGSTLSQLAFDTTQTTANMLPMILASSLLSGGLGAAGVAAETAAKIGEVAGATLMGVSSAGNSYQQALAEGWDKRDARLFSTIMGAAEGSMQYLLGGISKLGGGNGLEEAALNAAKGINNGLVRWVAETGTHIASEVNEELLQNRVERLLTNYLFNGGEEAFLDCLTWNDDDWYTVMVTALSTGALEGPGAAVNLARNTKLGKQLTGEVAAMSEKEAAKIQGKIESKQALTQREANKNIISNIGEAMKGDAALDYTLLAIGENMMYADGEAHELASRMVSGKAAKSAANYGELYSQILNEFVDRNGADGYDDAMLAVIGGAIAYHKGNAAEDKVKAAQEQVDKIRRENPGAKVLDANASALKNLGAPDSSLSEYAPLVNKMLSGARLTEAETAKLSDGSMAAKAARVYIGRQLGINLNANTTEEVTKATLDAATTEIQSTKKQQEEMRKMSVVQAAMNAADRAAVNRATANTEIGKAKWSSENQAWEGGSVVDRATDRGQSYSGWKSGQVTTQERVKASDVKAIQKADAELKAAQSELDWIKRASFKELASAEFAGLGKYSEAIGAIRDLQKQLDTLNAAADRIAGNKFPTKQQRDQLANIRQQQADIKQQIGTIGADMEAKIKAEAAEARKAQPAAAAQGEAARNSSGADGDTIKIPGVGEKTRAEFVQEYLEKHPDASKEQANELFEKRAAETGGYVKKGTVENEQQSTSGNENRNDVGDAGNRPQNSLQGDQSERAGGREEAGRVVELRSRGDELVARVDETASVVDGEDLSTIIDEFSDVETLRDMLKDVGFDSIKFVVNGNMYNEAGQKIHGAINGNELVLQLAKGRDYFGVARHEAMHLKLAQFLSHFGEQEKNAFVSGALQSLLSENAYKDIFKAYFAKYSLAYKNSTPQELAHLINEEILCDMIGGIDGFGTNTGEYQSELADYIETSGFDVVTQNIHDGAEDVGKVLTTEEIAENKMPYGAPIDTLISASRVDEPSTAVANTVTATKDAMNAMAKAMGFHIDGKTKVWYRTAEDAAKQENGFKEVTYEDIENSPIGELIDYAKEQGYLSDDPAVAEEMARRQKMMFADIGTISDKTNDFYMAMQFYGSAFFTAMKTNADKQYGTTYDMTSICTKTQSVINAMSKRMVEEGRGLKDSEILEIYQNEFFNGQPVPCPECYVFSRWIGIGGLLNNIKYYQDYYGAMTPEEVEAIYSEQRDQIEKAAAEKGLSFGKEKSKAVAEAQKKYDKLKERLDKAESEGRVLSQKDYEQLELLKQNTAKLRGLTWIDQVYFGGKAHKAENVNPRFRVPNEVLFDLNNGEAFVRDYKEAWAFRTTQGAGYGKAITPTAEAHLGEGILVTQSTNYIKKKEAAARAGKEINTFYNERGPITGTKKGSRGDTLAKATKKQRNQLFIGGQRLQSTSDARYDTAIDYLMVGLEMQAMHGAIQVYTKVLGAVPFFNRIGAFSNMSMMPYGGGLDADGNPLDTRTGGVDLETMKRYREAFERAGSITIGVNDAHIRAMMGQIFRDFIIPYHASGGNSELIAEMRRIQEGLEKNGKKMPQSTDYTLTQTDKFLSDTILKKDLKYTQEQIDRIHAFRDMRIWLLTGHRYGAQHMELLDTTEEGLTENERNARVILQELATAMEKGGKWEGVSLAKGTIEGQIFPNEFWDTTVDYEHSGVNTQRYLDYCQALGVLHRFSGKGVKTATVVDEDGKKQRRGVIYTVGGRDQFGNDTRENGEKIMLTDLAYKNGVDGEIEPFFWKLLVDRRMYGNNGQYLEQNTINLNGLVEGENAEEAVSRATFQFTNKNVGFASPAYEGERKYNHRESMSRNRIEIKPSKTRNALAMDDPGYETSKREAPVTDDRGQVLYVEPTSGSWAVARDTDGSLLNTDYIKNELGLPIYDNPKDAYKAPEKAEVIPPKHRTSNSSTEDTYTRLFGGELKKSNGKVTGYIPGEYGEEGKKNLLIVDASSGMGLGANLGKQTIGENNVIDLEPYPGERPADMPTDYESYGSLVYDMENPGNRDGQKVNRKADFVISNAVINVMAQDAREEHMAALLRMMDEDGTIFINPAFPKTWGAYNKAIPLEEYKQRKANGEDVSKLNVILAPATDTTGGEIYTAQSKSVQKGYTPKEFTAFAKDVAKQVLGYDVEVTSASGKGDLATGFLIRRTDRPTTRFALSPDQQKNQNFNNQQTEVGSKLKTLQGTNIQRYKGIAGKEVSPQVYVHKDYAAQVVPEDALNRAEEVLSEKYPDFQYNTIMYDKKTGNIRFDEAPDFDTAREPIAGNTVTVTPDGETRTGYSDAIWHHKWLWVGNDYQGFNVADSWNWSKQWLNTIRPVDVSEHKFNSSFSQRGIANGTGHGTTNWNEQLEYFGLPKDETQSRYSIQGNVGYHAGDLGKAEYLNIQGRGRGTGHFGTGTYFVGEEEKVTKDSYYGKRPQHAVDFSNYNLYKVRNNDDGYRLHDALKIIDGGINKDWIMPAVDGEFNIINPTGYYDLAKSEYGEDWALGDNLLNARLEYAKENGIDIKSWEEYKAEEGKGFSDEDLEDLKYYYEDYVEETLKKKIADVNEDYRELRDAVFNLSLLPGFRKSKILSALLTVAAYQDSTPRLSKSDSYATVFMKNMGYDGVDVRDTGLDNTTYGSVIYDVKPETVLYAVGEDEDTTSSNPYPENTLEHDLLAILEGGDPEALGKWVTEQLDANTQAEENSKIRPPVIPTKGFVPKVSPQQKAALETKRKGLIQAKGAMKPSEKNANGFQMPKFDENNNRFRRNIQNVGSAEQIPQDAVDQLENFAFTDVAATYVPDSNKVMIEQAKREISQTGDLEKSKAQFQKMARDSYDHTVSAQDIAFGEQLLIETSRSGDTQGFLDTLASLVEISTTAGKTLQAFRMLKQSGPIGQLYYMEKVVDRLNNNLLKRGYNADITINKDMAQAVLDAETDEDRDKALDILKADIAKQMPITLKDRLDAWRYLSMLGNFRTHIRNVVGNAIFVPIRFTKDIVAAGNEFLFTKAGLMDQQDRTKAIKIQKEWKSFAKEQAEVWKKELQGNGKYNPAREILEARKVLPGFLDALNRINSNGIGEGHGVLSKVLVGLEGEDWAFLRPAFTRALAMALQNTGYSVKEIRTSNNKEVRQAYNRAIKIAIEEAQKATYRDYSAAASALNRLKRLESDKASGRFFGVLLEGTLPFTKTPINILRRGIEYSPIGLATSIASTINGAIKHNMDGAQIADSLASGLTGTAVMILGWLLARSGILRGKRKDDKEEQFEKLQGYQDYSIQWGNQSFTIDWAAPGALPLFTGAALAEVMDEDEDLELADAWDAMMMIAEPMMSLSMLSGLNDVLSSASYADDNQKLMTIGKSMLSSYLGQMFPTIGGQLARSIDGTRRQTYVDKNSKIPPAMQRFIQSSIQNKMPVWEEKKAPYVDQWGRQSTVDSKVIGAMENFFAPWYRSVVNTTDIDEQLQALYDSKDVSDDNHKTILPKSPEKSFKVNGEDKYLTADEYVSFATDVGQTKYKLLTSLLSDARYLALTDDQKALAVKYIYDYATAAGKYHIAPDFNIHRAGKWIEEAEAAGSDYERFEIIWAKIAAAIEK